MASENEPEKKLNFTPEELDTFTKGETDRAIGAEREKWDAEARQKAEAEKAERTEREAKEQGKWKELAEKHEADVKARDAQLHRMTIERDLRDHLAEKHPDYLSTAKYILPHIPADTAADKLGKAIEAAVTQYVADNPRQAKGGAGVPPLPRTGQRVPAKPGANGHTNRISPFSGETSYL